MTLTLSEKRRIVQERHARALQEIGAYFLRNYDSALWDGSTRALVRTLDRIEAQRKKLSVP